MTCQCGRELIDQTGQYFCRGCGRHCVHCDCPTPIDIPVPDTQGPLPDGLVLWSEG